MADQRFSALASDPRYRLPNRKKSRTAVDPRFKGLFTDQEFRKKASVDRYGRKIKPESKRRDLEKLYQLDQEDKRTLQSKSRQKPRQEAPGDFETDPSESEEASSNGELVEKKDPAREGFSESSSEEESSDEESDAEVELAEETAGHEQTEDVPMGEVSRRIAVVNLDWDNIRAVDIMAVASSFVPNTGRIKGVTIYPSEFGKDRLDREELEGPPREIFASSQRKSNTADKGGESGEDSDDDERIKKRLLEDQANEGEEFDTAKLRQYQLERLKYYYAVIECDSKLAAKALYDSMDGREYLSTSNFFDLRFVPDDTSFDEDDPHDECVRIPSGYRPNEFRTEALTHSKVRLTWDDDDPTRKEIQKRAFSRAEMDENDLQAYIGTDDSDADSVASRKSAAEDRRAAKKAAQKEKMRAALGLGSEMLATGKKDKDEPVGDMQITFTSGLSNGKGASEVFENAPQDEESVRDRYIRKERERKQKRKEKAKASRDGTQGKSEAEDAQETLSRQTDDGEEDPFNDPFFTDPAAAAKAEKNAKKAEKLKKHQARDAQDAEARERRAELELLMADEQEDSLRHFDMREIEKAQKEAKRKGKGKKKRQGDDELVKDDFELETQDPRFKALFENHEYAIDPTNSRYKDTASMKALLDEGRKKRKFDDDDDLNTTQNSKGKKTKGDEDLSGLVARLKGKSASKKR